MEFDPRKEAGKEFLQLAHDLLPPEKRGVAKGPYSRFSPRFTSPPDTHNYMVITVYDPRQDLLEDKLTIAKVFYNGRSYISAQNDPNVESIRLSPYETETKGNLNAGVVIVETVKKQLDNSIFYYPYRIAPTYIQFHSQGR